VSEPIDGGAGLALTLFPVPGKVPLYLEATDVAPESEAGETCGVSTRYQGRDLVYIPGCAAISDTVRTQAEAADVMLFRRHALHRRGNA
jgi:pyrroloquinoline quinone biosynthesis protein B